MLTFAKSKMNASWMMSWQDMDVAGRGCFQKVYQLMKNQVSSHFFLSCMEVNCSLKNQKTGNPKYWQRLRNSWLQRSKRKKNQENHVSMCQDGRVFQGPVFRSQSPPGGMGSNPTSAWFVLGCRQLDKFHIESKLQGHVQSTVKWPWEMHLPPPNPLNPLHTHIDTEPWRLFLACGLFGGSADWTI